MYSGAEIGRRLGIPRQAVYQAFKVGRLSAVGFTTAGKPLFSITSARELFGSDRCPDTKPVCRECGQPLPHLSPEEEAELSRAVAAFVAESGF